MQLAECGPFNCECGCPVRHCAAGLRWALLGAAVHREAFSGRLSPGSGLSVCSRDRRGILQGGCLSAVASNSPELDFILTSFRLIRDSGPSHALTLRSWVPPLPQKIVSRRRKV